MMQRLSLPHPSAERSRPSADKCNPLQAAASIRPSFCPPVSLWQPAIPRTTQRWSCLLALQACSALSPIITPTSYSAALNSMVNHCAVRAKVTESESRVRNACCKSCFQVLPVINSRNTSQDHGRWQDVWTSERWPMVTRRL